MNILDDVKRELERLFAISGIDLPIEINPSRAEIKDSKLSLELAGGFYEAEELDDTIQYWNKAFNFDYEKDTTKILNFLLALPITIKFISRNSGEAWRNDIINKSMQLACFFRKDGMIKIPALGISSDKFAASKNGLCAILTAERDKEADIVEKNDDSETVNGGYVFEQAWNANIIINSNLEVEK